MVEGRNAERGRDGGEGRIKMRESKDVNCIKRHIEDVEAE